MTIQRVSAPEAVKLQKVGYVILDVSAPEEYAKGHPVGALNIPHKLLTPSGGFTDNAQFMAVMQAVYPKDTKILVVCRIGKRSLACAEELAAAGYTSLCDLRPGLKGIVNVQGRYDEDGWETMGLPYENATDGGSYAELKERAKI